MTAQEHYQAGELREAVAAALDEVRQKPMDVVRRSFLAELLCIAGDLERADKQLDTLVHQDPTTAPGVQLFRQLIRAEEARQQFFAMGRVPEFLGEVTPSARILLEASILLRESKPDQAAELLARADEERPKIHGACDGKAFEDLRDLDDRTSSVLEVLTTTGRYFWVPMERIELLEFAPPTRPRDLLWRKAHLIVREGPDGEVYLPAIYAGAPEGTEDRAKLGRVTEWIGGDGTPVQGVGQRTLLIGDEARPLVEIETITIGHEDPAG